MRLGVSSLVIVAFMSSAMAADWPQFRGPKGDGTSPETGLNKDWKAKPPKELWRVSLGDGGYANVAVAAGKVFIIDKNGKEDVVRAIDIKTGKDVWQHKYPDNYDSKNQQWGNGRSTPACSDGKVYTLGASGLIHCLDAEKGTVVWTRDCKKDFGGGWRKETWGYSTAPIIDGDKVIVHAGGKGASVVALDKNTGKDIWRGGGDDQPGYATPVIATLEGKKQYVVFTGFSVIGVDAADGKLLWRYPWETSYDINAADPIILPDDHVFITSGYGKGCAMLKIAGGKATPVWDPTPNKTVKAHFNSPILIDGMIYANSDPGDWVCLDPKTGKANWRQLNMGKGGAVYADGALIIVNGSTGTVSLVKPNPASYQEVASIKPLEDRGMYWAPPVLADGKLFVRSQQNLVCLDLK